MTLPICVYIIHRHRLFFDAVSAMFDQQGAFTVVNPVCHVGDVDSMPLTIEPPAFDVALIDAAMEDPDAMAATRECKCLFPSAKVVIVGIAPCENTILQAIEAGASGYTVKDDSCSELFYNIQAVYNGRTPCSPRIAALVFARIAQLAQDHRHCAPGRSVHVTPREHEILQLLASGYHNAEIAHRLGITLHTVKNHVHHILDKFQVSGRREAIQRAYEHGMLTEPRPLRVPLVQGRYSWV